MGHAFTLPLRGHLANQRIVLDEQRMSDSDLRDIDKGFVVACGTRALDTAPAVRDLARDLASSKAILFLGRHLGYNTQEITARGARTIVSAEEGDETIRPFAHH